MSTSGEKREPYTPPEQSPDPYHLPQFCLSAGFPPHNPPLPSRHSPLIFGATRVLFPPSFSPPFLSVGAPLGPVKLVPNSSLSANSLRKALSSMHQAHKVFSGRPAGL
jgi:hypothetical protein